MTTVVTSVLSTTGNGHGRGLPVYTSAQAWEDAAPADLVVANVVWRGECYNDGLFYSGSGTVVEISGSTSDATHYKELVAAPGNSFSDSATAQTNALRFDAALGVAFKTTGVGVTIGLHENYARLNGLQVAMEGSHNRSSVDNWSGGTAGCITNGCLLENIRGGAFSSYGPNKITNSICIIRSASSALVSLWNGAAAYNCTFVAPSNFPLATYGAEGNYGSMAVQNCAFFGCASAKLTNMNITFTNCVTNAANPPAGCTTVAYDTATGSGFQNITDAARDFRIKATSAFIDAGVADPVNASTDIVATARPQGGLYDIGCWEYVSAAAAFNPLRNLTPAMGPILAQ